MFSTLIPLLRGSRTHPQGLRQCSRDFASLAPSPWGRAQAEIEPRLWWAKRRCVSSSTRQPPGSQETLQNNKDSIQQQSASESVQASPFLDEYQTLPTIEQARKLPIRFRNCSNDLVFSMSVFGNHGARRERLVREVMRVDNIGWEQARQKVEEMNAENDKGAWLFQLPYRCGVFLGFAGAFASIPLVFHKDTAFWMATHVVNMPPEDIPNPEDLKTVWQVGGFTWEWMEPVLGTASFFLLGLQFMRAQMHHIDLAPYSDMVAAWRARRLSRLYPQYDRHVVEEFSRTDKWSK